jgi:hypothetical protein
MSQAWTVITFGVMTFFLFLWSLVCLAWIYFKGPATPDASLFPEMDIMNKCHDGLTTLMVSDGKKVNLSETLLNDAGTLARLCDLRFSSSADIAKVTCGKRVFCGVYQDSKDSKPATVITTEEGNIEYPSKHESSTSGLAGLLDDSNQARRVSLVESGQRSIA